MDSFGELTFAAAVTETVTAIQILPQDSNDSELDKSSEIVPPVEVDEEQQDVPNFIVIDETGSADEPQDEPTAEEGSVTLTQTQSSSEADPVKEVTESPSFHSTQAVAADDLFIVDSQPSTVDENDDRRSLGPRYRRDYDGFLSGEVAVLDEGDSSEACPKGEGRCFNCLGDHMMTDCPKPRDNYAISRNRRNFFSNQPKLNRYHADESTKFDIFKPGVISDELRKALGLGQYELPTHIYRMRMLGYPPGWLEELKQHSSGISLMGTDARGNDSAELKTKYDLESIIEYPGFNVPAPPNTNDGAYFLGYPPMLREHSKEAMMHYLTHLNSQQPTHKRFADEDTEDYPKKKMKFEETTETDNEEVDMELSSNASLDELETQRLALLDELKDITETPTAADNPADDTEPPGVPEAVEDSSSPRTPVATKLVELGTPIGVRFSPYGSVPSLDRFAQGMAEIPFEEVAPMGIFDKVKNVLKRVKQSLTRKS